MKTINNTFKQMVAEVPANVKIEVDLSFAIADRIDTLIKKKGLTKWLSGQHNFTIRTLATLSAYFDESLIIPA